MAPMYLYVCMADSSQCLVSDYKRNLFSSSFYLLFLSTDFSRKWQKVPEEDAGLLHDSAGQPHTRCPLVTHMRKCMRINVQNHLRRKTGKMLLVLFAWSILIMPFFYYVRLMKKVAVPTCVELVSGTQTALISIERPTQRCCHPIMVNILMIQSIVQLWVRCPVGLWISVKFQSLLVPFVEGK